MDILYRSNRLKMIRKLDLMLDYFSENKDNLFEKCSEILGKFVDIESVYLFSVFGKKIEKLTEFHISVPSFSENSIYEFLKNVPDKKSVILRLNDKYVNIRQMKFYKIDKVLGYYIFVLKKEPSFKDKLFIRDFMDFTNNHFHFINKINNISSVFSKYIPYYVINKENIDDLYDTFSSFSQNVTILFSDIRSFTSFSEKHEPKEVIDMLNSLFAIITEKIYKHDGIIDKFIGDAVLAVFGLYGNKKYDLKNAINCAIEIQKESEKILKKYALGLGIGINKGKVISGNLGNDKRMEYTVIGDTVNTAERLEAVAKKGEILITENTYNTLNDEFECEFKEKINLKGKKDSIKIFKVLY